MTNILPKAQILMLLRFERDQEQMMVKRLSDAERNAPSDPDHWTAKDYLANVLLWKELQTQALATILRGDAPPVWTTEKVQAGNDEGFRRFKDRAFQDVQTEGAQVHDAFIAQVERLSDEELNDPLHFAWQEGEPLRGETLGNGLWHPCTLLSAFYLESERKPAALQLQEDLLATVRTTDMPAENFGVVVYNAACFFARNGQSQRVLQLLPEALRLRPTLVELSKHDEDLAALRTDPRFQALYDDPALKAPESVLVSVDGLRDLLMETTPPVIVDVRGSTEYAAGHIAGAINIPVGMLKRKRTSFPAGRIVITYCNMHHRGESRGERAAAELRELGVDARTLDGGYPGWKDSGFPVE